MMEKRNANATENAARAKRVRQARKQAEKQSEQAEDWCITATYTVGVMRTIDGKEVSEEEAIEIAAEEVREAKPQDFDFKVIDDRNAARRADEDEGGCGDTGIFATEEPTE